MHRQSISNTTQGLSHVKVTKGHQVQMLKNKVYFSVSMHMEGIPGIMGGQNQLKIIKGHQV